MTRSNIPCVLLLLLTVASKGAEFNRFDKFRQDGPLYPILVGKKYGFINEHGKVAVAPRFTRVSHFSEGLCFVLEGKLRGYIRGDGAVQIPLAFEGGGEFSEGIAPVRLDGKWGFIDQRGTFTAKPGTVHGVELADAMHLSSRPPGAVFVSFDQSFVRRANRAGATEVSGVPAKE